jgi:cytochrome c biogenesis protein CcmG, thiol:disulfide interchange protein DsbE
MNWRKSLIGIGISVPILGLLAYGLTVDPNTVPSTMPGRPAPAFALPVLDSPGDTARLADHRGDVVVVNFWASWCLECRYEHSDLSIAAERYASQGVRFYGVLYADSESNGRDWIRQMGGQSYPALIDRGSRTAISFGLRGVPETFIIDQEGTVVHMQLGVITLTQLASIIEPLLAAQPGGAQ